jgi:hypothetical protein
MRSLLCRSQPCRRRALRLHWQVGNRRKCFSSVALFPASPPRRVDPGGPASDRRDSKASSAMTMRESGHCTRAQPRPFARRGLTLTKLAHPVVVVCFPACSSSGDNPGNPPPPFPAAGASPIPRPAMSSSPAARGSFTRVNSPSVAGRPPSAARSRRTGRVGVADVTDPGTTPGSPGQGVVSVSVDSKLEAGAAGALLGGAHRPQLSPQRSSTAVALNLGAEKPSVRALGGGSTRDSVGGGAAGSVSVRPATRAAMVVGSGSAPGKLTVRI